MKSLDVNVGLDYHDDSIQVCGLNLTGGILVNKKCRNDWKDVANTASQCGKVKRVAIEACTGACHLCEELIENTNWIVELAHPGYIARMKRSPDKTDYGDARILADLLRVGYLPGVWLPPREIREYRKLVRYRQQLVDEQRRRKLQVSAILRDNRIQTPKGATWTLKWMRWLAQVPLGEHSRWIVDQHCKRIKTLKQEINDLHNKLSEIGKNDKLVTFLLSLDNVGIVTAWMLRVEIGRFDRFNTGKQLSRFCGLSPRNVSSGSRQADGGLIKAGNPQLRATIIQLAQRLVRSDPRWIRFAQQKKKEGKPNNVIIAAVGNRWLRWLYHQVPSMTE